METPTALTIIGPEHPARNKSVNPAVVYLASLGPGSRRAMGQALRVVAGLLTGTETEPQQWCGSHPAFPFRFNQISKLGRVGF